MRSARVAPACPDELPVLSAGGHADPREGACVMEYVAVLAGEPFGDHPRCVHAALAVLARWVNDRIRDDRVRSGLALLAPDLIAVDERDPRVGDQVVVTCLLAAAAIAPLARAAAKRLVKAEGHVRAPLADGWWPRLRRPCRSAFAPPECEVRRALSVFAEHAAVATAGDPDQRLADLLGAVVLDCRRLAGACSDGRGRSRPALA